MSFIFRLTQPGEENRVIRFINDNFDMKLPLVNRQEYFDFYYRGGEGLQFAVAEEDGQWLAIAGYILASRAKQPDLWVSIWVSAPGHNGVGLELMDALPGLTGARVVACNNIRHDTMAFYRFLGWHADRIPHYYRLAPQDSYCLAQVEDATILPAGGDLTLDTVSGVDRLWGMGMPATPHTPAKDSWYMARRYFGFPHQAYQVYSASEKGKLLAYLVTHVVDTNPGQPDNVRVLRIVDFIGADEVLPRIGGAVDRLLRESGAEYADCYCWGIPAETFAAAGFCERKEGSANIIPNYLTPPLYENTEYYFFTSQPKDFVLFKADGDQDRPNLPAE